MDYNGIIHDNAIFIGFPQMISLDHDVLAFVTALKIRRAATIRSGGQAWRNDMFLRRSCCGNQATM